MITALDHIQLAMPPHEEEKARAFFGRLLGFAEEDKPAALSNRGGCWFRRGSVIVHLGVEREFQAQRKAHPAFCVEDLDTLAHRLQTVGTPIIWDDTLPSRRRFYATDPFGNRLEFLQDGDGFAQR